MDPAVGHEPGQGAIDSGRLPHAFLAHRLENGIGPQRPALAGKKGLDPLRVMLSLHEGSRDRTMVACRSQRVCTL